MLHSLIIAINEYPLPHHRLRGCINDAKSLIGLLESRVPEDKRRIHTLFDEQATRQGIIDGFAHFQAAQDGDTCLLYFSGHGSRAPSPPEFLHQEPDGLVETLVCHDSRLAGGIDLLDKELSYLIWEAQQGKQVHFLTIFDCCHSGTVTRGEGLKVRMAEPSHLPVDFRSIHGSAAFEDITAQLGKLSYRPPRADHIAFAAARSDETAKELRIKGQPRGVFTYNLVDVLTNQFLPLAYRDLVELLRVRAAETVEQQTPQIEGPQRELSKPFLGAGKLEAHSGYLLQYRNTKSAWEVNAGQIHGFPAGQQDDIRMAAVIAGTRMPLRVVSVDVASMLVEPEKPINQGQSYRVLIEQMPVLKQQLAPARDLPPQTRQLLEATVRATGDMPYLELVDDPAEADMVVRQTGDGLRLTLPGEDRPLVRSLRGVHADNLAILLGDARHIARWHFVQQLHNSQPDIPDKAFEIEWYRLDEPGSWSANDMAPASRIEDIQAPQLFSYQEAGPNESEQLPALRIKVRNTSQQVLYFSALYLSANYGISNQLLPNQRLQPGEEAWLTDRPEGEKTEYRSLPLFVDQPFLNQGVNEVQEYFKIFINTEDVNTHAFNQPGLQLEDPKPETTRSIGRRSAPPSRFFGWRTVDLRLRIHRQPREVSVQENQPATLATGVQLQLPAGASARARLVSPVQLTRGLGDDAVPPASPGWLPFGVQPGQQGSPPLSTLELRQVQGADQVTADHPAYLQLPAQRALSDEIVLAVGFDPESQQYYPLGSLEADGRIRLDALPPATPDAERSIGGSIKLFFVKTLNKYAGFQYDHPQLSAVDYQDDPAEPATEMLYETDTEKIKERLASADRALLYIHGFAGDSRKLPEALADQYDLVLAFDYESLNTPIEQTGRELRLRLTEIGLGQPGSKKIHLLAHGMGGLVARFFIEKGGGATMVSKVVMVGTPHQGTPYATVYEVASFLTVLALNKATFLTPYMVPINILGQIAREMSKTLMQMKHNSSLYKLLNDGSDPGIPYVLIGGNTQLIQTEQAEKLSGLLGLILSRFRDRAHFDVMDQLFKSANDVLSTVESQTTIPGMNQWQQVPEVREVGSDHISYFAEARGMGALREVL